MKIQKFKQLFALLIVSLIFAGVPAMSAPTKEKRSVKKTRATWQDTITITCPDSVVTGVKNAPQGWLDDAKRIQFKNAFVATSGSVQTINCDYAQGGSQANLFRDAPKGYLCKVVGGNKSVECKRIKPPIRIKPKG